MRPSQPSLERANVREVLDGTIEFLRHEIKDRDVLVEVDGARMVWSGGEISGSTKLPDELLEGYPRRSGLTSPGGGTRLFSGPQPRLELERTELAVSPNATHISFTSRRA